MFVYTPWCPAVAFRRQKQLNENLRKTTNASIIHNDDYGDNDEDKAEEND